MNKDLIVRCLKECMSGSHLGFRGFSCLYSLPPPWDWLFLSIQPFWPIARPIQFIVKDLRVRCLDKCPFGSHLGFRRVPWNLVLPTLLGVENELIWKVSEFCSEGLLWRYTRYYNAQTKMAAPAVIIGFQSGSPSEKIWMDIVSKHT